MFKSRSWRGVLDTTLCDKVCQWLATGQWFSAGTLVSSTNKTDRHNWNIQTKSNLYMTANKHNLNACSFQLQLIHYQDFLHLKIRKQSRIYKLLNFDLHIDEVELQLHEEAVVAVIVWYLYLQLPVQSVPITTKVVSSSNPTQTRCTRYNIMW
jgi:hypothetical protein